MRDYLVGAMNLTFHVNFGFGWNCMILGCPNVKWYADEINLEW